jgi:hypothetical protein
MSLEEKFTDRGTSQMTRTEVKILNRTWRIQKTIKNKMVKNQNESKAKENEVLRDLVT